MKNLKLIFAGLCWASVISGVSACEMDTQEQEELRVLCAPIIAGQWNIPNLESQQDSEEKKHLEKYLLTPFMEKVALVPRGERLVLVSLITPWFALDECDMQEIILRMSLLKLTEKLTQVPSLDRAEVMRGINRMVDLILPGLEARQKSRVVETNSFILKPMEMARRGTLTWLSSIEAPYLKPLFDLALPEIESAPQDRAHLFFGEAFNKAKENLGIPQ